HFGVKFVVVEHPPTLSVIAIGMVVLLASFGGPVIESKCLGTVAFAISVRRQGKELFLRSGSSDCPGGNQSFLLVQFPRKNDSTNGCHTGKKRGPSPKD